MAMERPCWTITFALIWVLTVPGIILTHVALNSLIPSLRDLPSNIVEGFDETFRFAYLKTDAQDIKLASEKILQKCNSVANPTCTYSTSALGPKKDIKTEKDEIVDIFANSLSIVQKVVDDKYFGADDLQETADNLDDIKTEIEQAPDEMYCAPLEQTFCSIYNAADGITQGMSMVDDALDAFRNNPVVDSWEQYTGYLMGLHALPWVLVLGLLFFLVFWYKAGKCCPYGFCLIPFILLWLLNFVLYVVILAVGVAVMYGADRVQLSMLKGEPTMDLVLEHFKTEFKEFWDLVFAPMIDGMISLFNASCFFVPVLIFIKFYGLCMCCCCPYAGKDGAVVDDDEGGDGNVGGGGASYTGPMDAKAGRGFIQAARAEYVEGQGPKVGDFFDVFGGAEAAFGPYEERIRGADDKDAVLEELAAEWGVSRLDSE